MELSIQAIHFHASDPLLEDLHRRIEKLETFYPSILRAEVFLKLEKAEPRKNKQVEIKLHVPKHELFAKEYAASFELAASEAVESLRRQLRKLKGKKNA